MSKQHLTFFGVKNFKRFDSLELTDIGQFNLIVGDNNVGKTSLLEAISMLSISAVLVFFSCNNKEGEVPVAEKQVCWHNETTYSLTQSGQIGQYALIPPSLSSGQTKCESFNGGSYWSIAFTAQDGTHFARYAGQVLDPAPDPIEIFIQESNLTYDWSTSKSGAYAFQRTEIILSGNDTVSIKVDSTLGSIQRNNRANELKIQVDTTLLGVAVFIKNDYDFSIGNNGFGQLSPSNSFGYQDIIILPNGNTRKLVILGKKK